MTNPTPTPQTKTREEFMECSTCAAKPGSPYLCEACLHNRKLVNDLKDLLARREQEAIKTKNDIQFHVLSVLSNVLANRVPVGERMAKKIVNAVIDQLNENNTYLTPAEVGYRTEERKEKYSFITAKGMDDDDIQYYD